jgi:nucleoside-diphosphate-sugar epimerase
VTGAGGFLGANLVDRLSADTPDQPATEIHVLSRSGRDLWPALDHVTVHHVDLADSERVAATIDTVGATHLCHLAWLGPEHADRYRSPANDNWVDISRELFTSFAAAGGRRIVHVGSCIEYGNEVEGPRHEGLPLAADTAYGRAKADVARLLDDDFGDIAAVARIFFCYGPHEQRQRLVPSIVLALQDNQPVELTEGRQRRDFLDARDAAAALEALLRSDATGAFNIGAGASVEVRSVAQTLGELFDRTELLRFGARPDGADSAADITADIGRITSVTGWEPTISLEEGLAHAIAWWAPRRTAHES